MARLTGQRTDGRSADRGERGQLILVAAFALAVTFVALALVVNSAIYTENLASRGEGGASGDALDGRQAVEAQLGNLMSTMNVHRTTSFSDQVAGMDRAIDNTTRILGTQEAANGRYVGLTSLGHEEGTRIADNTTGGSTFVGSSGVQQWTVARTSATRAFVMNVSRSSVTGGTDTFGGTRGDEFEVNVTDGSDVWLLNLTDRADTFTVGVATPSGSATCVASGTSDTVEVDLTQGTVGDRDCRALSFGEGVSGTYDIEFNNSDEVVGNYSLVVDRDGYSNAELQSGPTVGDPDDPYARVALYSSTVRYRYDAPTIHYETDVRVAPGETDG